MNEQIEGQDRMHKWRL